MKRIYLYLLFVFLSINAVNATNYYIDKANGNDSNPGTSPGGAWRSISKVNATKFAPGDSILFRSGQVWNEQLTISSSGTSSKFIVYGSYGTGARPKIDGNNSIYYGIYSSGKSYVKIMNFEVEDIQSDGRNIYLRGGSNVIAENNYITLTRRAGIYFYQTRNSKAIKNSIIVPSGSYPEQTDGIYSMDNGNNHYDGNYIIIGNEDPNPHADCIQSYRDTSLTVSNGYYEQRNNKTSNAQGIYATTGYGTFTFYNNVVYAPNTKAQLICYINLDAGRATFRAYNNTAKGGQMNVFRTDDPNAVVKNNIFITTGNMSMVRFDKALNTPSNIDYNIYYTPSASPVNYVGSVKTYTNWKSMGFEKNGSLTDPKLDNNYVPFENSPAIDKGTNLGSAVSFDKNGVSRPQGSAFDIGAFEIKSGTTVQDVVPPTLESVNAVSPTSVKLVFSESLSKLEAENIQNYEINNNLVVKSSVLGSDLKTVTIQTETISSNVTYTLIVKNVKDLAGNVISLDKNSGTFSFNSDQTQPTLLSATATSTRAVKVFFSEEISKTEALNIKNYSVNNNLVVEKVTLEANSKVVYLQTSRQKSGSRYTLTVSNVKDLAGNLISSTSNKAEFSYTAKKHKFSLDAAKLNSGAILTSKTGSLSKQVAYFSGENSSVEVNLTVDSTENYFAWGRFYYEGSDSTNYLFLKVDDQDELLFGSYLNSDKWLWDGNGSDTTNSSVSKLSLGILESGSHKISLKINPLVSSYVYADVLLITNDSSYVPSDADFSVTDVNNTDPSMKPVKFELEQNYPNPFNPTTKIKYSVAKASNVVVKVYNSLGAEVTTLVNGNKAPGNYEVQFNASNLPSGIYIYQITADNFVESKKMILLK